MTATSWRYLSWSVWLPGHESRGWTPRHESPAAHDSLTRRTHRMAVRTAPRLGDAAYSRLGIAQRVKGTVSSAEADTAEPGGIEPLDRAAFRATHERREIDLRGQLRRWSPV